MCSLVLSVVAGWRALDVHVLVQFGGKWIGRGVVCMRLSMLPIAQPSPQIVNWEHPDPQDLGMLDANLSFVQCRLAYTHPNTSDLLLHSPTPKYYLFESAYKPTFSDLLLQVSNCMSVLDLWIVLQLYTAQPMLDPTT